MAIREAYQSKRGAHAREEMKDGIDNAWDDMRKAMEKVAARFR